LQFFKHGFDAINWKYSRARLFDSPSLNIKQDDRIEQCVTRICIFDTEQDFNEFNARFLVSNAYNYNINFETYDSKIHDFSKSVLAKNEENQNQASTLTRSQSKQRLSKMRMQISNTKLGNYITKKLSDHSGVGHLQSEMVVTKFKYTIRNGTKDIMELGPLSENLIALIMNMQTYLDFEDIIDTYGSYVVFGDYKSLSIEIQKAHVRASMPVDPNMLYEHGLDCLKNGQSSSNRTIRGQRVQIGCVEYATLQTDEFYKVTDLRSFDMQQLVELFLLNNRIPNLTQVARRLGHEESRLLMNSKKYIEVFIKLTIKDDNFRKELLAQIRIADTKTAQDETNEHLRFLWNDVIKFPNALGSNWRAIRHNENELDCLTRLIQNEDAVRNVSLLYSA
jgi:hypothetical protein